MVGLHYSRIVLLVLLRQCYAQSFPNPPACKQTNQWATNLVNAKGQDPCQVHETLRGFGFSISCCFEDEDIATVGLSNCGPCNLQSYNLLAACIACVFSTSQENFERLQPPPPFSPNHFPAFVDWNQGSRKDPLPAQLLLPPWINIPPSSSGIFDLQSAIANDSNSPPFLGTPQAPSPSPASANTAPNSPVTPSEQTSTKDPTSSTDTTSSFPLHGSIGSTTVSPTAAAEGSPFNNEPPPPASSFVGMSPGTSKHSNAGIIAGAVIGALLVLGHVFGALFIIRRRCRARIPSSAQFYPLPAHGHR